MNHLTERERITIFMMRGWDNMVRLYRRVAALFNAEYRLPGISQKTVGKTISRFQQTGNVKDRPKIGRPKTATDEETSLNVALSFVENPRTSIRQVSYETNASKTSVYRIMKLLKFHSYKIKFVQELNEDDFDRRLEFAELMMNRIDARQNFLNEIVFSDECTFQLDGNVNRHNCRFWAPENPHWFLESHTQHPQKLNVWAGIINDRIVGPFFIEGNLTGVKYEDMLRTQIVPAINEIVGDNFNITYFQQDGAAPHYARNVRNYLDEIFPGRVIGRRGNIEWPPRSPDMSPLDYFLWGYLKNKVYATKPANLEELRQRIIDTIQAIPNDMIQKAVSAFYDRMGHCQLKNGEHFEREP